MHIKDLVFEKELRCEGEDKLFYVYTHYGRITVLDRLTGWGDGNIRDIETGYTNNEGKFWLASGDFDIRRFPEMTIEEAISKIKEEANTCVGI